jgi:hypothetical protein
MAIWCESLPEFNAPGAITLEKIEERKEEGKFLKAWRKYLQTTQVKRFGTGF